LQGSNSHMDLLNKLRFKAAGTLYVINAPGDCHYLFEGMEVKTSLPGRPTADQLILFAESSNVLDSFVAELDGKLADDAVFWIAYPKKSGKIQSDLVRNEGWKLVFSLYNGVSSAAVNNDWSAVRFKKKDPSKTTNWVPMEERKTEGVDYVARTVVLPPDALKAMKPFKGLDEFFYAMSFSHKREYVEAIADAKKPETRLRRIEKMIEMLLVLRTEKELKKSKTKP